MRQLVLGALLALTATGLAATASGKPVTYTFNDRVLDGVDVLGLFGAPNKDLTGDLIDVVFTLDTSVGKRTTGPGPTDSVIGAAPSSPVTATVTINGATILVGGGIGGAANTIGGEAIGFTAIQDTLTEVNVIDATPLAPASLDDPFTPQGLSFGTFSFGTPSSDPGANPPVDLVNFQSAPEPATWGLMLMGVGMAGVAMRAARRRRTAAPA